MKNSFGDIITDQKRIANLLNYHFSKLGDFFGEKGKRLPAPNFSLASTSFKFQPISLFLCKKALNELNSNKPLGPSNIPAWALKDCMNIVAEPLQFLINAFIFEGSFPQQLKQARITPIFKSGDAENPKSYRPLTITSALAKIFEKILNEQITEYLNRNNLICPNQLGFRKKMSTSDALILATENIRREIDENEVVAAACLDLSKAFDSISYEILLQKLEKLNFDSNSISMIRSFLTCRSQKVCFETACSDWINLHQGVPQGTILGPLLFNIYVNSMHLHVTEPVKIVQFADDTFLFAANEDIEVGTNQLERVIENLLVFFSKSSIESKCYQN